KICDESATKAEELLIVGNEEQTIKKKIHTRITAVPVAILQDEIGELVPVTEIPVRISQPTCLQLVKKYSCNKCEYITVLEYDWERQIFGGVNNYDLIDKCTPGDDVEISGKILDPNNSEIEIKQIFENYWNQYTDNPLIGRDRILSSICPW
ncbi:hypothetical protein PV326_002257, partial [Microctonus aethiopoides]